MGGGNHQWGRENGRWEEGHHEKVTMDEAGAAKAKLRWQVRHIMGLGSSPDQHSAQYICLAIVLETY